MSTKDNLVYLAPNLSTTLHGRLNFVQIQGRRYHF